MVPNILIQPWSFLINRNMRCIEIKRIKLGSCADSKINRNMRCIEIPVTGGNFKLEQLINRNMRCIEIGIL